MVVHLKQTGARRILAGSKLLPMSLVAAAAAVTGLVVGAWGQSALDGFDPGANGTVLALAIQQDGKILVGGDFSTLGGGGAGITNRSYIGRLNPDGSVDPTFNPGANGSVEALAIQPDGRILAGGEFTLIGGGGSGTIPRNAIARLNPDGSVDTNFNAGASGAVSALVVQPDGDIIVGGAFLTIGGGGAGNTPRSHIARLNPDGALDTGFDPGADDSVSALVLQPDGSILVGGLFTRLGGGGSGNSTRNHLGRLNPNGTLDPSFDPGASDAVNALVVQADGMILVGGLFTGLGGGTGTTLRNYLGRLNPDGTLDTNFNPGANAAVYSLTLRPDGKVLVGGGFTGLGGGTGTTSRSHVGQLDFDGTVDSAFDPGANDSVYTLVVQPDGKVLAGGAFTTLGGGGAGTVARNHIGRLYGDGTPETAFDPGANLTVYTLAVQADGEILAGGNFTTIGGGGIGSTARQRIARLKLDGTVDATFDAGASAAVYAIAVQPDGEILVGGNFTTLGGGGSGTTARSGIGRLNPDGTVDASFNPGANGTVFALAVQPDGKILVGGAFTTLGGGGLGTITRNRIGRLNPDGSVDTGFDPGADGAVYALAVEPNGQILLGGNFTGLGGGTGTTTRNRIGRVNANGTLDSGFNPGANNSVTALKLQADGKIVLGGLFSLLGGGTGTTVRAQIGRLNADGTVDTNFNPGANGPIYGMALQADGRILVGGAFSTLGGGTGTTARNNIGRINPDGSLDRSFDPAADNPVYALTVQGDGKILAAGDFTSLGGGGIGTAPRNRIG